MSDREQNKWLLILGVVTSLGTIGGVLVIVGDFKGTVITTVNSHSARLDRHESSIEKYGQDIAAMQEGIGDIKARLHGVSSKIGKLPGQIAAKSRPGDSNNPNNN